MAVKLEGTIKRYLGLSTDTKPMPEVGESIAAGSSFMETDTGAIYRFDGTAWRAAASDDEVAQLLVLIAGQLEEIKTILQIATAK